MTQWAEVRHLHLVEDVPKKEIARRLKLDVKTVRRAIGRSTPPARVSAGRPSSLAPWRERITQWLREDPKVTAKRIRRLLMPLTGPVSARTVRRYVAGLRAAVAPKEAFVHRSVRAATTMEVDFGESWVDIAGVPRKVKYLVATLPFSNAYFAKAYTVERLESLLDGIESAFRYYGGLVDRVVLDNTSLAVKAVLAGRDRVETEAFEAFRGGYPFRAEFCAPAKGWEKGSVETGVKYVRNLVFRPRLAVESWAALNAAIITELEADLPTRHLDCSLRSRTTSGSASTSSNPARSGSTPGRCAPCSPRSHGWSPRRISRSTPTCCATSARSSGRTSSSTARSRSIPPNSRCAALRVYSCTNLVGTLCCGTWARRADGLLHP